jgi:hypothetical protein
MDVEQVTSVMILFKFIFEANVLSMEELMCLIVLDSFLIFAISLIKFQTIFTFNLI